MEVVEILQRLRELDYSNEQATALLKLQLEERQQQRQLQEQQQRWLLEERQQQFNFELQMAQVKAQSKCKGEPNCMTFTLCSCHSPDCLSVSTMLF